jgi:hypothetical protein
VIELASIVILDIIEGLILIDVHIGGISNRKRWVDRKPIWNIILVTQFIHVVTS